MNDIAYEMFAQSFKDLQAEVHANARIHGWHDEGFNKGEKLALIHSEVSEALEAERHGNPPDDHIPEFSGVEAELADTVIRIMDYAALRGINVADAIIAKHKYNEKRPYKHGGKKF